MPYVDTSRAMTRRDQCITSTDRWVRQYDKLEIMLYTNDTLGAGV